MAPAAHATSPRILPVILAGGVGARLAPISTDACPKPFLPLADGQSLLTRTLARVTDPELFLPPLLVGRAADRYALLNHARAAGLTPAGILLEATGRNTALAVAAAVAWAERQDPMPALLAVLPADHWLPDPASWQQAVRMAAMAAWQTRRLCLLGAQAHSPSPDFGYIRPRAEPGAPWHEVLQFIEKPADPAPLIAQGACWNMGQFIALTERFGQSIAQAAPALLATARATLDAATRDYEFTRLPPWPEEHAPIPFDRAVVEKTPCAMVPYSGEWQDLGTLAAWEGATGLKPNYYGHLPPRTDRPWGYFELIEGSPTTLRKRLVIYPGCRLSRQRHLHRSERWTVVSGIAHVEKNEQIHRLEPGQAIAIPRQCWHRLSNHHQNLLIIEEIQHGEPREDDIERAEDDYGRL